MGKDRRILPPGPNPREDLMKEKDQKKLRQFMRRTAGADPVREEGEGGEEYDAADQAEGERDFSHSEKVKHTPDQAEGERRAIEEEIEAEERKTKH